MQRPIIAVDIDDVLSANAEGFINFSNETWGHNLTKDDYVEDWRQIWKIPLDEAMRRSDQFHASGVVSRYAHIEEAIPVLQRLKRRYELIVVTSRQRNLKEQTVAWLDRYFPDIFQSIHYAGIWDDAEEHNVQERVKHTKARICRELGADYLIDDQIKHCVEAAKAGIRSILFGDYSWNKDLAELPGGVVRAKTWKDVEEYFDAQS
jgi:uncharacterized HAD superfamily protein